VVGCAACCWFIIFSKTLCNFFLLRRGGKKLVIHIKVRSGNNKATTTQTSTIGLSLSGLFSNIKKKLKGTVSQDLSIFT
jgi:hypothetical protein